MAAETREPTAAKRSRLARGITHPCVWLGLLVVGFLVPGCASRNVNPVKAAPKTGYVDFYTVEDNDLSWDVRDLQCRQKGFSEFNPVKGNILRLAFPEGDYQLRISFLNRAVLVPATNAVPVRDGMVTPVKVHLVASGTANVYREETHAGGTVYGRYGRTTKIKSDENVTIDVKTEQQSPIPYAPKDHMPYRAAPVATPRRASKVTVTRAKLGSVRVASKGLLP